MSLVALVTGCQIACSLCKCMLPAAVPEKPKDSSLTSMQAHGLVEWERSSASDLSGNLQSGRAFVSMVALRNGC